MFTHQSGVVAYARSSFQQPAECPTSVAPGSILRFHHAVELNLEPANYSITFGLASTERQAYLRYHKGLTKDRLLFQECSRIPNAMRIRVDWPESGNLAHFGMAGLPDSTSVQVSAAAQKVRPIAKSPARETWPTVLHVTHWKAGSQWIRKILDRCAPGRIIEPQPEEAQVRYFAIQAGHVYPTVYLRRSELAQVALPSGTRKFVVIRDLRDTLISAYFSFKASHPIVTQHNADIRETLQRLETEEGMLFLMDGFLRNCADIQLSWVESDEPVIRYEELLLSDVEVLTETLIGKCGLPVAPETVREAILANRFENLSGRARGQEDRTCHERKGIAGDWRNHFTPRMKQAFKARFGGLLVTTGYEPDLDW